MLESLVNPRHNLVRIMTAGLLRQIARSPSGHSAVLVLLDSGMAAAERVPHHCTEFFRLLSDLVSTIATAPPEVGSGRQGVAWSSCDGAHSLQAAYHPLAAIARVFQPAPGKDCNLTYSRERLAKTFHHFYAYVLAQLLMYQPAHCCMQVGISNANQKQGEMLLTCQKVVPGQLLQTDAQMANSVEWPPD